MFHVTSTAILPGDSAGPVGRGWQQPGRVWQPGLTHALARTWARGGGASGAAPAPDTGHGDGDRDKPRPGWDMSPWVGLAKQRPMAWQGPGGGGGSPGGAGMGPWAVGGEVKAPGVGQGQAGPSAPRGHDTNGQQQHRL